MDKIFIRDLTAETTIGIYNWERDIRQKVLIDLEMEVDASIELQLILFQMLWITHR